MIVYDPNQRISWEELATMTVLQPQFKIFKSKDNSKLYYIDFLKSLGSGNQGETFLTYDLNDP